MGVTGPLGLWCFGLSGTSSPPVIVGSSGPSEILIGTGESDGITLPVPAGSAPGDDLYAVIMTENAGLLSPWPAVVEKGSINPAWGLYKHTVAAGDPSEWKWSRGPFFGPTGSISGVMISVNGGGVGADSGLATGTLVIPDVSSTSSPSMLLAVCGVITSTVQAEGDFIQAVSPLALQVQHNFSNNGVRRRVATAIAVEDVASPTTFTGRSFSETSGQALSNELAFGRAYETIIV